MLPDGIVVYKESRIHGQMHCQNMGMRPHALSKLSLAERWNFTFKSISQILFGRRCTSHELGMHDLAIKYDLSWQFSQELKLHPYANISSVLVSWQHTDVHCYASRITNLHLTTFIIVTYSFADCVYGFYWDFCSSENQYGLGSVKPQFPPAPMLSLLGLLWFGSIQKQLQHFSLSEWRY